MLDINNTRQIEGVTIYGDHERINVFYLVPQQPRYRRYEDGTLAFRFLKYRFPVDRPGGKKGGGFLIFDVEFIVDQEKMPAITDALQREVNQLAEARNIDPVPDVVIGDITYTKGETDLQVAGQDGTFVEKLHNPGKPSLYGRNIASFALELSQEGSRFFELAMQEQGGSVSIFYDLWLWGVLPEVSVNAYFNATAFYTFYQTIDTDWNVWSEDSYRETIRESLIQSEAMTLDFEWGGVTDEKVREEIRSWATRALEDAVERKMIEAVAPVPEDQRNRPDGIEDVTRNISNTKISNVRIHYRERQTVEWNIVPQGVLQNITSLTDGEGNPIQWSDYSSTIDLDDPFFKQLRVDTLVNANFQDLPIHSVEVKVLYDGKPMANLAPDAPEGEVVLNSEDDVGKFATFVENDNWKYTYSYQVNYRGESRIYQSPEVETNEGNLTIGVDDVGVLSATIAAGDINWSEVERALVTFSYDDVDVEPIEDQFQLTLTTQPTTFGT